MTRLRVNGKIIRSRSNLALKVFDTVRLVGVAKISDILALIQGKADYVDLVLYDDRPNFWETKTEQRTLEMKLADPEKLGAPTQ